MWIYTKDEQGYIVTGFYDLENCFHLDKVFDSSEGEDKAKENAVKRINYLNGGINPDVLDELTEQIEEFRENIKYLREITSDLEDEVFDNRSSGSSRLDRIAESVAEVKRKGNKALVQTAHQMLKSNSEIFEQWLKMEERVKQLEDNYKPSSKSEQER